MPLVMNNRKRGQATFLIAERFKKKMSEKVACPLFRPKMGEKLTGEANQELFRKAFGLTR
jgi:hypothetical protein